MTPGRLEPAASRSQVKHSTTKPLRSLHDIVLKKLNFDLPECETQALDLKLRLICFIFIVPLSACESSVKMLTTYCYCVIYIFDLKPHLRGQGVG